MGRIEEICALIEPCSSFADVGCDHGFCSRHVLEKGLSPKVYITDISPKSLQKAEILLQKYIKSGACVPVCCDGLSAFENLPEQVLIAGMGGEEIIKILSGGLPQKFILQPMKNVRKVREFLLERGCKITRDDIFYDGKYYFIIKGESGGGKNDYTAEQLEFGKDSLNNPVFINYINEEIEKCLGYLALADMQSGKAQISEKINYLKKVQKCTRPTY